jgi:hypothetical protein
VDATCAHVFSLSSLQESRRARGDYSFLLESKYFLKQESFKEEVHCHGYEIIGFDDDETDETISRIEPIEI